MSLDYSLLINNFINLKIFLYTPLNMFLTFFRSIITLILPTFRIEFKLTIMH